MPDVVRFGPTPEELARRAALTDAERQAEHELIARQRHERNLWELRECARRGWVRGRQVPHVARLLRHRFAGVALRPPVVRREHRRTARAVRRVARAGPRTRPRRSADDPHPLALAATRRS